MRRAVVAGLLGLGLAGCAKSAERPAPIYISVGADAAAAVRVLAAGQGTYGELVASSPDVAVLEVDADELEAISQLMHEQFDRCGGFIVHDSMADARTALQPPVVTTHVDYSIDHAPVVNAVLPALDRSAIKDTIAALSSMPNRYYRSDTGAAASTWLRDLWRSYSTRTDVTIELFDQGYPQQSVIMTIPGTTRADEVVVIGGHLDSISMRGGKNGNAPGADDDASGIATLSEVARVLLAKNYRPARTIKFIAYAAEEIGLRGSQAVVKELKRRGIHVVGALQLDMTNYQGSDKDIWLMKDFTNADQNAFVAKLIDTYVGATWGLDACGYGCSDHASWYRAGVPASMPFESRMRDHNKSIHTSKDTLELSNNNADHALKFAKLGAAYAIEMAKGELGPPPSDHGTARWQWIALLGGAVLAAGALLRRK
ncbi:MAG TPA: M20/M25/M40 family metallo-hydrolase [Kofleriaceae bacterium]